MNSQQLTHFQESNIRRIWYKEEWWFSIVDVCGALTDSKDSGAYWRKLKQRLLEEGSEVVTICHGLKLKAPDGKMRETDCSNTEGLFRIIQSRMVGIKRENPQENQRFKNTKSARPYD